MSLRPRKLIMAATGFALGLLGVAGAANATLMTSATIGGVPTGVSYVNFDNLALGNAGGSSGGVGVTFAGDAQTVTGAATTYAPPFISNTDGMLFGDLTVSGADATKYLTTGVGSATLMLPGLETYFGLLWGSVDLYNTLRFYNGSTLVGTATGVDVTASANGNQGINGTYYVNIVSDVAFNKVTASSSQYAFELDNVAYNPTAPVPEPFTLSLLGLGLVGAGVLRRKNIFGNNCSASLA
jgi:hypothetical protein